MDTAFARVSVNTYTSTGGDSQFQQYLVYNVRSFNGSHANAMVFAPDDLRCATQLEGLPMCVLSGPHILAASWALYRFAGHCVKAELSFFSLGIYSRNTPW